MAIKSFGTKIYVGGYLVGGLTGIGVGQREATIHDVTTHESADNAREFHGGMVVGGEITLSGFYEFGDDGQDYLRDNIGQSSECYVIYPDNSGFAFAVEIQKPSGEDNPDDEMVLFSATIKISGPVSIVYPTLTVTGITDPTSHDPLVFASDGFANGKPQWTVTVSTESWLVFYTGTAWTVYEENESLYTAIKTTTAMLPDGLTGFTVSPGAGQPTITGS